VDALRDEQATWSRTLLVIFSDQFVRYPDAIWVVWCAFGKGDASIARERRKDYSEERVSMASTRSRISNYRWLSVILPFPICSGCQSFEVGRFVGVVIFENSSPPMSSNWNK